MSNNSLVKLNALSIPTFSEANDLLVKGNKGMQDSITGFADILKGIQTETRNRNDAAIQNLINSAQSTGELRSPEFQQRMADLVGTFSNEYDAKAASAYQDGRVDTLDKRYINQQTMDSNQLNYEKNQLGYDQDQLNAAYLAANREAAGLGYKTPEEAIKNGVNVDPISYNQYVQGNEKHDTDILNTQQNIAASKNSVTMAQNKDKREQTEFDAEENKRKLDSNIASGQNQQLYSDNPQVGNKYYKSQVAKMQSPAFLDSYQKYGDHVNAMSAKYGVPPELVWAVIGQESVGKVDATSPTGVRGIMQVTRDTFRDLGVGNDRTDPLQSIEAGTKYLGQLLAKYDGDYDKAIVAYNSGLGNVDKAVAEHGDKWLSGIRAEGQDYLPRIKAGITYARTGNTGSQFIDPTAKGSGGGSGGSGSGGGKLPSEAKGAVTNTRLDMNKQLSAVALKQLDVENTASKYKNVVELEADIGKGIKGSSNQFKTLLSIARGDHFKQGFWGGLDKESHKQYEKYRPAIKEAFDKLSPQNQAAALEMTYSDLSRNSFFEDWDISTANVLDFQAKLSNNIDRVNSRGNNRASLETLHIYNNAIDTIASNYGLTVDEAMAELGISKDAYNKALGTSKDTGIGYNQKTKEAEKNLSKATPQQAAKVNTAQDPLVEWAQKIKSQGHDKIPAVRSSLRGRQAIQAGLL